ncbi:hypothetical protein BGX23_001833 [Mortierella sp. AD031]|nr:hypothetical protein BGX23_001833 [Mortierella sp. AD031]
MPTIYWILVVAIAIKKFLQEEPSEFHNTSKSPYSKLRFRPSGVNRTCILVTASSLEDRLREMADLEVPSNLLRITGREALLFMELVHELASEVPRIFDDVTQHAV